MKRIILSILISLLHTVAVSQCYEPNIQKADAAYARGEWRTAYEYYKNASSCPDAKRFENGKKAKAGIQKCQPVLTVDGQKELNITVGRETEEYTFKVTHRRLDSDGWSIRYKYNCEVLEENHNNNTITIKWGRNNTIKNREMSFSIYGYGIEYVEANVKISQQGWPDEVVTLPANAEYDTVVKGSSGISFVLYHGKYGFVDSTGKALTPLKYTYVDKYDSKHWGDNDMLMGVYRDGKYGYIDRLGREVVPLQYDTIVKWTLRYGISTTAVRKSGKWGLLNGKGEEVVPCVYDDCVSQSYSDIYPVIFKKDGKWAFFGIGSYSGGKLLVEQLTEFKYDWVCTCGFPGYTSLCRVAVRHTEGRTTRYLKGYVDQHGKEVILPQFEESNCFGDNNRAIVKMNGKSGFINSKGEIVIPCQFDDAKKFQKGLAWVKEGVLWKQIDTTGNYITNRGYKKLYYDGRAWLAGYKYTGFSGYLVSKNGQGDTVIVGNYGKEYISPTDFQNDFEGLVEAAEKGIDACQYALSRYYKDNKDYVKSFEWCRRAANGRNPKYIADLAYKYSIGLGCKVDEDKALRLNVLASVLSLYSQALDNAGFALWYGKGCKIDHETAIGYLYLGALAETNTWSMDFLKRQSVDIKALKPY